jgi:desulfoferrodoxin (superoxide reductase-like protein)
MTMKLVYTKTNVEVKVGDIAHIRGVPHYIMGITKPHKPASTGRVQVQSMDEKKYFAEFYPSVVDADWIEREDRQ